VLGAGFDTRAYRLARHSDKPVFEVDQQINVDRKRAVVARVSGHSRRRFTSLPSTSSATT
jgi:O-methyltransferase involved in polyketide biosynthesis